MDALTSWRLATFVKDYLPEEANSGRIERELSRLDAPLVRTITDMVTVVEDLDVRIDDNFVLLDDTRLRACRTWNRMTLEERDAARRTIEFLWTAITSKCERLNTIASEWLNEDGRSVLVYFNQAMRKRLNRYQEDKDELARRRDEEPELAQAYGEKIPAQYGDIQPADPALYTLLRQQVLPPNSLLRTDRRTGTPPNPRGEQLDRFRDASITGGMWRSRIIGRGGQGEASAHEFVDGDGNVIDRVVQKDSLFSNYRDLSAGFHDPQKWHGDTTISPSAGNCVPMEAHTQCLMGEVPLSESDNTVRLLAAPEVWYDRPHAFRLYMEFAPHGDVKELIKLHAEHREPVPEMFLWLVFRALLRNALIMEQGGIQTKRNPWSQIVHCDLKAENLFLGPPNEDYYPHYPTPKLGDFGLAFPTNDQDPTNPDLWFGRGTPGHYAPEQRYWVDSISKEPMNDDKLLSPCNVYGLATIMYQLMERKRSSLLIQPQFVPDSDLPMFEFSAETEALYYREDASDYGLCPLVRRCLNANPNLRPPVEYLLGLVNDCLESDINSGERYYGRIEEEDDMLLIPGREVRLKWVSRLENGIEGINRDRVPLGQSDEEMTDA